MRPFSPFCGTVSNAQLFSLLEIIRMIAPGVVTTQLSFLPPASSSATDVPASSERRPATAQPPEPPPTTTKSNVSLTRFPLVFYCRQTSAFASVKARVVPRGEFSKENRHFTCHKSSKAAVWAFPKGAGIDTYAPHPLALRRGCLLRKPLERTDRRARAGCGFS